MLKLRKTRFDWLYYANIDKGCWQYVVIDPQDPQKLQYQTGPHYASKAELLGDLTRFATTHYGYEA